MDGSLTRGVTRVRGVTITTEKESVDSQEIIEGYLAEKKTPTDHDRLASGVTLNLLSSLAGETLCPVLTETFCRNVCVSSWVSFTLRDRWRRIFQTPIPGMELQHWPLVKRFKTWKTSFRREVVSGSTCPQQATDWLSLVDQSKSMQYSEVGRIFSAVPG